MAEHTLRFPLGTWVKGVSTHGDPFEHGLLTRMDQEDGEHWVKLFPSSANVDDWVKFFDAEETDAIWVEAENLEKDEAPDWLGSHASHAFVYDWMDDDVANVSLHAEPQDIIDAYFADATEDERAKLQLKLMEAVVDPGERIELVPGGGSVRFCVVNA